LLDVAHAEGYMIDSFKLHEAWTKFTELLRSIKVERVVLNALAPDAALPGCL
jgi:hypothetical protein